jgi:hypothetical protein
MSLPHPRFLSWQKKLLDLSRRNPLLNLPPSRGQAILYPSPSALLSFFASDDASQRGLSFGALPFSEDGPAAALGFLKDGSRPEAIPKEEGLGNDPYLTSETVTRRGTRRRPRSELSPELNGAIALAATMQKVDLWLDEDPDVLSRSLADLARTAKSKLEEGGVHTLYLAIGLLEWKDSASSPSSDAPAFLLPVSLSRANARAPFKLFSVDPELSLNPALATKLEQDFGLDFAPLRASLAEQDLMDDEGRLENLFALLSSLTIDVPGAKLKDEARLGLFTFAKHHLWNDLKVRLPELETNPLISAILEHAALPEKEGPSVAWETLDVSFPPTTILTPLPADASQLRAIAKIDRGDSLVIQGPPGTGKSQTITNIIAHALGKGKRVLFVSEKMNALNVVRSRLEDIALGPYCLELHSTKLQKSAVIEQLRLAVEARPPARQADWVLRGQELQQQRVSLNESLDALHFVHPCEFSIYSAIGRLAKEMQDVPPLPLALGDLTRASSTDLPLLRKAASRLTDAILNRPRAATVFDELELSPPKDPGDFFHALARIRQACARLAFLPSVDRDAVSIEDLDRLVSLRIHLSQAPELWTKELAAPEARAAADSFLSALEDYLVVWRPFRFRLQEASIPVFSAIVSAYRSPSIWPVRWFNRKKALKQFIVLARGTNPLKATDLEEFASVWPELLLLRQALAVTDRALKELAPLRPTVSPTAIRAAITWLEEHKAMAEGLGELVSSEEMLPGRHEWTDGAQQNRAADAAHEQILIILEALFVCRDIPPSAWGNFAGPLSLPLSKLQEKSGEWLDAQALWPLWASSQEAIAAARKQDLGLLVDTLRAEEGARFSPAEAANVVERQWLETWVNQCLAKRPELLEYNGARRAAAIIDFAVLDAKFEHATQLEIAGRVHKAHEAKRALHPQEMAILRREFAKQSRHLSVRQLVEALPNTLLELKPCFLMSPLSVAQFLPKGMPLFDLVIFDEASQISVADSVGAISRGKQVVVVGDPKQMPPGHLFEVGGETDDGDDDLTVDDLKSILDECMVAMQEVTLNWHYRSRHEDLIAFSNRRYYGDQLITFPPASTGQTGITLHQVAGVYDRGSSRTNHEEALAVIKAVSEHVYSGSKESIGVITFNQQQQRLIERLLDDAMRKSPELERLISMMSEELFVKSLENVQGDERDLIFFSTTFGRDQAGRFLHTFGPLSQLGGERRLNVAITRARQRMEIFTSFAPEDIDIARIKHAGVRDLRDYLEFARGGALALAAVAAPTLGIPDSPFEVAVANALRARGWDVLAQVGCSGYKIDLAVLNPVHISPASIILNQESQASQAASDASSFECLSSSVLSSEALSVSPTATATTSPGKYLAGIECDGATYHSFKVARDRDRMRQKILEGLGWNILRIWSTDWFARPEAEIARIDAELRKLVP